LIKFAPQPARSARSPPQVTFYEILIGRTPFEKDEDEVFTDSELHTYWERSRAGHWLGEWELPESMEHLLRYMICPETVHRITALQAYHHVALQPSKESLFPSTPTFVREAVYEPQERRLKNVRSDVVVRKKLPREREREREKEKEKEREKPVALAVPLHEDEPEDAYAYEEHERPVEPLGENLRQKSHADLRDPATKERPRTEPPRKVKPQRKPVNSESETKTSWSLSLSRD
jgi:serine/threonine protein kinase